MKKALAGQRRPGPAYRIQPREVGAWATRGPSVCRVRTIRPFPSSCAPRRSDSKPSGAPRSPVFLVSAAAPSCSPQRLPAGCSFIARALNLNAFSSTHADSGLAHDLRSLGVRITFPGSKSFPRCAWPGSSLAFIRFSMDFSKDLGDFSSYSLDTNTHLSFEFARVADICPGSHVVRIQYIWVWSMNCSAGINSSM